MTNTSVGLQDHQQKISVKAKAEATHRFWGLYGHVCKKDEPRALRRVTLDTRETAVLTEVPHPYPQFKGITKQVVTYTRNDGVGLSGTLYLPASCKAGDRLPLVIWSYPGEFVDARIAGQVRADAGSFTALRGPVLGDPEGSSGGASSVRVFATQGYAVLFMASMPVIGDPKTRNDTYIEQIVAGARAAIEKLDSMVCGPGDHPRCPRGEDRVVRQVREEQSGPTLAVSGAIR